jgi:hypothetical protein
VYPLRTTLSALDGQPPCSKATMWFPATRARPGQ